MRAHGNSSACSAAHKSAILISKVHNFLSTVTESALKGQDNEKHATETLKVQTKFISVGSGAGADGLSSLYSFLTSALVNDR